MDNGMCKDKIYRLEVWPLRRVIVVSSFLIQIREIVLRYSVAELD